MYDKLLKHEKSDDGKLFHANLEGICDQSKRGSERSGEHASLAAAIGKVKDVESPPDEHRQLYYALPERIIDEETCVAGLLKNYKNRKAGEVKADKTKAAKETDMLLIEVSAVCLKFSCPECGDTRKSTQQVDLAGYPPKGKGKHFVEIREKSGDPVCKRSMTI